MNSANKDVREKFSVDVVNSAMLLMKMESVRLDKMRDAAWSEENTITPHGQKLADDVSKEVPVRNGYNFTSEVHETYHE